MGGHMLGRGAFDMIFHIVYQYSIAIFRICLLDSSGSNLCLMMSPWLCRSFDFPMMGGLLNSHQGIDDPTLGFLLGSLMYQ